MKCGFVNRIWTLESETLLFAGWAVSDVSSNKGFHCEGYWGLNVLVLGKYLVQSYTGEGNGNPLQYSCL